MRIDEMSGEYQRVRAIMYNVKGDKAVYHWRNMRQMVGNVYVGEAELDDYGNAYYTVYAKWPGVDVALYWEKTNGWREDSDIVSSMEKFGFDSKESFLNMIDSRIKARDYIRLIEIEALTHVAPELVNAAKASRDECMNRREELRAEKNRQRIAEDQEFIRVSNAMTQEIVNKAIETIKVGGVIENKDVTFWKNRYDRKTFKLIPYLMDQYGVNVPIRTRGWICNRLNSVTVKDGYVEGCNWMRSKNGNVSEKFWDCMDSLIKAVGGDAREVV